MTIQTRGISKRSLLLLGGVSAVIANPATRQKVLDAVNSASGSAHALLDDTVRPLVREASRQVQSGSPTAHREAETAKAHRG